MAIHTIEELKQRQALPLEVKILMSKTRIREWINEYGEDGVYIAFSGGKDSTVLLDLVREDYPGVKACFVDTGLEYPEIRDFIRTFDNVDIIRPKMNFKQVIEKYGYPFFSKETAESVYNAKRFLEKLSETQDSYAEDLPYSQHFRKLCGLGEYSKKKDLIKLAENTDKWEMPYRVSVLLGTYEAYWNDKKKGLREKDGAPSRGRYSQERYKFMLNAPFNISHLCCSVMKKNPAKDYAKKTQRTAITAQMAEESLLRQQQWLINGCNGFNMKKPTSNPLSFWTEQDILRYIKEKNLKICSVYGEVVVDYDSENQLPGQLALSDLGFMEDTRRYKTTGCSRTGCMFCGFGCHLEKPGEGRFERMKETHPKLYDYIMRPKDQGGLNYKEVIDWINANSDLNIRY